MHTPTDLCLCFLLLGLRSVTIGAVGGRCQAFPGVGQRFLIRCGRSRIRSGRSRVRCSRSLIRCGRSLITCGMSLITCGMSLITCGMSLITCGRSLIRCGRSLIRCGRKLVQTNPYRQLRRNKNIIYTVFVTVPRFKSTFTQPIQVLFSYGTIKSSIYLNSLFLSGRTCRKKVFVSRITQIQSCNIIHN